MTAHTLPPTGRTITATLGPWRHIVGGGWTRMWDFGAAGTVSAACTFQSAAGHGWVAYAGALTSRGVATDETAALVAADEWLERVGVGR